MSERLKELQRQRALAQEQLAWFDREIAKEGGSPASLAPPAQPATAPAPGEVALTAEQILAQYRKPGPSPDKDVKRGCYIYFVFALGLLIIFTAGAYLLYLNFRQ